MAQQSPHSTPLLRSARRLGSIGPVGHVVLGLSLFGLLSLQIACVGVGDDDDSDPGPAVDPLAWSPDEAGDFSVGYAVWEVTYSPPSGTGPRTIPIHIWYPTSEPGGETAVYEVIFGDDEAFVNAPPAASVHAGGYPVVAYSHGDRGFAGSSAFLMRHFASHGWVAVAPDHIGNTFTTNLNPRPLTTYIDRSADVTAAIDALATPGINLPDAPDTSAVVLSGHSFGGYTTWATSGVEFDVPLIQKRCENGEYPAESCNDDVFAAFAAGALDDRLVVSIPLAGAIGTDWIGDSGHEAVTLPILQMSGTEDSHPIDVMWDRTPGLDIAWVDIQGGCHQLFALGACSQVESDVGFDIVNAYALSFSRLHVLRDDDERVSTLLDGTRAVSDLVTYQFR